METFTIYEYMLDKDQIIQIKHEAEKDGNKYIFKSGKKKNTFKMLNSSDLDEVIANHVFSFEDNFDKYSRMILNCFEKRVKKAREKLAKDENILSKLKYAAGETNG